MQTYHYGDIYCRFYFSFQRKAEQSFPFTKAKQARGFMSAKRSGAAPFPDKSSSRFAASVFIGKTLYPTAPCKRAFENGNDRPAAHHRPKGKNNKVGVTGKQAAGTATAERQTGRRTARRRVFAEKIP